MNRKQVFLNMVFASLLGGGIALGGFRLFFPEKFYHTLEYTNEARLANYALDTSKVTVPEGLYFITAADMVRSAVVHVKTYYEAGSGQSGNQQIDPMFRDFFGDQFRMPSGPKEASGSGVILTNNGYIVTNNHVIENADKIEVVLENKKKYIAKLVGKDPATDLALLKIEDTNLSYVRFGSSDNLRIGEWVLAVGNPFNLTSTVTAGIVSAKARNINILSREQNKYAIESFIQTDAAVNPGNSGGALVNLKGELVGINTAIASNTGSYTGYSFAVPATLVKKIVDDLMNYGEVQRGLLGVSIQDVTAELAEQKGLKEIKGVYIAGINEKSSAQDAGIKEGDVILKIDQVSVNTSSELQEQVAKHRPGDKISVLLLRGDKEMTVTASLKNKMGTSEIVKVTDTEVIDEVGATFAELNSKEKTALKLSHGVKVTRLTKGKFLNAGMREGFIITHIDKTAVHNPSEVSELLNSKKGGVLIEGKYPTGKESYYAVGF